MTTKTIMLKEYQARLKKLEKQLKEKDAALLEADEELKKKQTNVKRCETRANNIQEEITLFQRKLKDVKDKFEQFTIKEFSVEKVPPGVFLSIHKKHNEIKYFSKEEKDVTDKYKDLDKQFSEVVESDFILEGYYDDGKVILTDVLYYQKPLSDLPLNERLLYLEKIKFNKTICNNERFMVDRCQMEHIVKRVGGDAIIRKLSLSYFPENSEAELSEEILDMDKPIIKNFVTMRNHDKENPELLIRMHEPPKMLKDAIQTNILNQSIKSDIKILWGESPTLDEAYIPLYDLHLKRISPLKIINLKETSYDLSFISPYIPMMATEGNIDSVQKMFEDNTSSKYVIEKNIDGLRAVMMKVGNQIKLYSSAKTNISPFFHTLLSQAKDLSNKNIVVEGMISGKGISNEDLKSYINKEKTIDEGSLRFDVFDVMTYNNEDVGSQTWIRRKAILHSLNYTPQVKEMYSIVVGDYEEAKRSAKLFNDEVIMKKYNSVYKKNHTSDDWVTVTFDSTGPTTSGTSGIPEVSGKKIVKDRIDGPKKMSEEIEEELASKISNPGFFDQWSGPMAYFLGLLSTDGYLDNSTDRIEMGFADEDMDVVKQFARAVGAEDPKQGRFRFKSKQMADSLRKLGMDVKKKGRTTFNKVPAAYRWDYARGSFDADGTIQDDRIQMDSENKGQILWMKKMFETIVDDVKFYEYDSLAAVKVAVLGDKSRKVLKAIYAGDGPRMKRKADKA